MSAKRVGRLTHRPLKVGVRQASGGPVAAPGLPHRGLRSQRMRRVPAAVQGGPDELGHSGVEHHLLRAAAAGPGMQNAGDQPASGTDQVAAEFDGRPGRQFHARVMQRPKQGVAERLRPRSAVCGQREPAAEIDGVYPETVAFPRGTHSRQQPGSAHSRVTERADAGQVRPHMQVDPEQPQPRPGQRTAPGEREDLLGGHAKLAG